MGQQLQIFATEKDNERIRDFLINNYECEFYQDFSKTKEGLRINDFNETYHKTGKIRIHNKAFPWTPTYSQTQTDEKLFYINNGSLAPIIEFSKTDIELSIHGRMYWSKYFSGNPTTYDVQEFEKFYNLVINWVKKNSKGTVKWAGCNIYYLEDAWERKILE